MPTPTGRRTPKVRLLVFAGGIVRTESCFGNRVLGLEAPFGNGLEAHWTHWLEASVTGNLPKQD